MTWSSEQLRNAQTIVSVGRKVGASRRDMQIALMAAIVESGLRNVHYGDRDSLGLFQQRAAWGSAADRTNPAKAAQMFFQGGQAGQRGLLDIANRGSMGLGQAAQAVQVSAFPDRYQQHAADAAGLLGVTNPSAKIDFDALDAQSLGRVPPSDALLRNVSSAPVNPSYRQVDSNGQDALAAMGSADASTIAEQALGEVSFDNSQPFSMGGEDDPMRDLHAPSMDSYRVSGGGGGGVSYSGGGGGGGGGAFSQAGDLLDSLEVPEGLGHGTRAQIVAAAKKMLGVPYVWGGTSPNGVDCSGLVQLIYKKFGMSLPRISAAQANTGHRISLGSLMPGDLVAYDNSSRNNGADHIAIAIGNGLMIEAPRPGGHVQIAKVRSGGWGVRLDGLGGIQPMGREDRPSRSAAVDRAPAPAPRPASKPRPRPTSTHVSRAV